MRSVPMPVHPRAEESGLGLCLRTLARSRLSLNWMRHQLQLNPQRMPNEAQMPALAGILAVDEAFILQRTVRQEYASAHRWRCGPHKGLLCSHVRVWRPQVCPRCVRETGFCWWQWDFALSTVCALHHCGLVDSCSACREPLRWDRPDVDLCRCKRPLIPGNEGAGEEARALCEIADAAVHGENLAPWLARHDLPAFMSGLSLAGLTALIQAFGDLPSAYYPSRASVCTRSQSTAYWETVVSRAVTRLRAWSRGCDVEPLVNFAVIRRMARDGSSSTDAAIAASLLRNVGRAGSNLAQRELFEVTKAIC